MTLAESQRLSLDLGADEFVGKIDTESVLEVLKKYMG